MKKNIIYLALILFSFVGYAGYSQTSEEPEALGLPGDNLNLYAVLDVFQKSKTLEEFEKSINLEENKINNLDLNNDNNADYIQVSSEKKGDTFFVLLQVSVSGSEKQDVAVIEVDKNKNGQITVQVIGDEELYGKDYIVEPSQNDTIGGTINPGYSESGTTVINNNTTNNYTTNNERVGPSISAWPVVVFLFSPLFVTWRSPWYWGHYPSYWRPWRPVFYRSYCGYHRNFYGSHYYRRSVYLRTPYYRNYYGNRRTYSNLVRANRMNNMYKRTYEGRVYKKPISPVVRPGSSSNRYPTVTRPGSSSNRYPTVTRPGSSSNRYPTVTRPGSSSNRYPTLTRPGSSSNGSPTMTRPGNSNNIPSTYPSTRPVNRPASTWPTSRPSTNPVSWPSSQQATRPVARPVARPSGMSRSTMRGSRN
ncbi:hypothetical protein [Flavobacterium sp. IMCC34518]|uniref:hypothetical protein n=1 Tax=Flavobacterium sp. IMCC34518 TaxID=3003623 RepID=UPI002482947C|nr:hypothetical protein [Flavobacterium sp. IMCC34518]